MVLILSVIISFHCLKLLDSGLCKINIIRLLSTTNYSSSQSIFVLASTSSTKAYKYGLIYEDSERTHFYTTIMCTEMTYRKP